MLKPEEAVHEETLHLESGQLWAGSYHTWDENKLHQPITSVDGYGERSCRI
jgi:hypothetical protein